MSEFYFIGDNHVGDKGMLKYRPYFKNQWEHDSVTWNLLDQVPDDAVVVFLGDNFLTLKALARLAKYKFYKVQVLGNHEFEQGVTIHHLAQAMDEIHGCYKNSEFWLTHVPMHPKAIGKGMFNIHGHMHTQSIGDPRYINVSMEATGYRLISLTDIRTGQYVPFQGSDVA